KHLAAAPAEADGTPWMELPTTLAVDALAAARRRDPARPREELAQHWASFPAKQRAELVVALTAGLGPDDEPSLEQVLDDKALSVRRRAAALLAALPDSAWRRRTGARRAALLRVEGTLRRRLEIAVPEAPDAAGVRDGLAPAKGTPSVQQR